MYIMLVFYFGDLDWIRVRMGINSRRNIALPGCWTRKEKRGKTSVAKGKSRNA